MPMIAFMAEGVTDREAQTEEVSTGKILSCTKMRGQHANVFKAAASYNSNHYRCRVLEDINSIRFISFMEVCDAFDNENIK